VNIADWIAVLVIVLAAISGFARGLVTGLLSLLGLVLGATVTILRILGNQLTVATVVLVALLLIAGLLFTLFAMLFDMESNRELR